MAFSAAAAVLNSDGDTGPQAAHLGDCAAQMPKAIREMRPLADRCHLRDRRPRWFKRNIFGDATIGAMAEEFSHVLRQVLPSPDAPLSLG